MAVVEFRGVLLDIVEKDPALASYASIPFGGWLKLQVDRLLPLGLWMLLKVQQLSLWMLRLRLYALLQLSGQVSLQMASSIERSWDIWKSYKEELEKDIVFVSDARQSVKCAHPHCYCSPHSDRLFGDYCCLVGSNAHGNGHGFKWAHALSGG